MGHVFVNNTLIGIFCVYCVLYGAQRFMMAIPSAALDGLKACMQWLYAVVFVYLVQSVGRSEGSEVSLLTTALLVIMYYLQAFPADGGSTDSADLERMRLNYISNAFVWVVPLAGLLLYRFATMDRDTKSTMKWIDVATAFGLPMLIAIAYAVYASVDLSTALSVRRLRAAGSCLTIPTTSVLAGMALSAAVIMSKTELGDKGFKALIGDSKVGKLSSGILMPFLTLVAPLLVLACMLGSTASDMVHQQKVLVVQKTSALIGALDQTWQYYDIAVQFLSDIIDDQVSYSTTAMSGNTVFSRLQITQQQILDTYDLQDALPLNLWSLIETYVQAKNSKFNMGGYYYAGSRNADPLSTGLYILPYNSGAFSMVVCLILIVTWAFLTFRAKTWSLNLPTVFTVTISAMLAYVMYLCKTLSNTVDDRMTIYCDQYGLTGEQCDASTAGVSAPMATLQGRIGIIKSGEGRVVVNEKDLFGKLLGDGTGGTQANMKTLYASLSTYGTGTSVQQTLADFASAFTSLVSMASSVNMMHTTGDATVYVYSPTADAITSDLNLSQISEGSIVDTLMDPTGFAASLGLTPLVPQLNASYVTDSTNPYFSILADPSTKNPSLFLNSAVKGQDFRSALLKLYSTREALLQMTYEPTMSPYYVGVLYSASNFDVNSDSSRYITLLKQIMISLVTTSANLTSTSSYQQILASVLSDATSWSNVMQHTTGGQYDAVNAVPVVCSTTADRTIITDTLMHAISPRSGVQYDVFLSLYLQELFWVTKLEMIHDTPQVAQDVSYIEKRVMGVTSGIMWALSIVVGVAAYRELKVHIIPARYFDDYFKSTVAGSDVSSSNRLVLMGVFLLGFYTIANFTHMYTIEESVVGSMKFLNKQVWGGKTSIISLIIAMCLGFVSAPMWFSDFGERESVFLATCVIVATMLTPMVYVLGGDGKATQVRLLRNMNMWGMMMVFALTLAVVITKDSALAKSKSLRYTAYTVLVVTAIGFTSVPILYIDATNPNMSGDEIDDRLKRTNVGVLVSLGLSAGLAYIYLVKMKKTPIYGEFVPLR